MIVVDLEPAQEPQKLDLQVASRRRARSPPACLQPLSSSSGTCSPTRSRSELSLEAATDSEPVARVVSGDGYDPESGAVTIAS